MLKRLFISLIILSALTSDGVVDFPGNICGLYIELDGGMSSSGKFAMSSSNSSKVQIIPADELIQKAKFKSIVHGMVHQLDFDGNNIRRISQSILPAQQMGVDKRSIFQKSDVSPPKLKV